MDLFIAFLPSLLFGSIALLLMGFRGDNRQQTLGELGGGFLVAAVTAPFFAGGLSVAQLILSFCSGLLLGWGIHYQIRSFHVLGVSRAMPISTAAQMVGIALLDVILFGQWRHGGALPVGLTALVLLVAGVVGTSWTERRPVLAEDKAAIEGIALAPATTVAPPEEDKNPSNVGVGVSSPQKQVLDWKKGAWYLFISSVGLISYLILPRCFDIDPLPAFFPQALGFLTMALILTSVRFTPELGDKDTRWQPSTLLQLIPGIIWGIGLLVMQYSAAKVGVATGFTLAQLGVVFSTLGAVLILKEKRSRKELWVMAAGITSIVAGAVLIGVAKAMDSAIGG